MVQFSRICLSAVLSSSLILGAQHLNIRITAMLYQHDIIGHLRLFLVFYFFLGEVGLLHYLFWSCFILLNLTVLEVFFLHWFLLAIMSGLGWNYPCDMWSIGCILVELCSVSSQAWPFNFCLLNINDILWMLFIWYCSAIGPAFVTTVKNSY